MQEDFKFHNCENLGILKIGEKQVVWYHPTVVYIYKNFTQVMWKIYRKHSLLIINLNP